LLVMITWMQYSTCSSEGSNQASTERSTFMPRASRGKSKMTKSVVCGGPGGVMGSVGKAYTDVHAETGWGLWQQ
jgi:predicted Rossmann-fold nucleotide-binding protein